MSSSKIEWTEKTWNPVTGCTKISSGCKNCYAEAQANWLQGIGNERYKDGFKVTLQPDKLEDPVKWKKPCMIFVNSMSDLFHESIPFDYIDKVFMTMYSCHHHTFQVLTKRAERMYEYIERSLGTRDNRHKLSRHIWLGVSVENQEAAKERIPWLLRTNACIKFLSCEPLLGEIDFSVFPEKPLLRRQCINCKAATKMQCCEICWQDSFPRNSIDWVIVGGESGTKARPTQVEQLESIIVQCNATGTPCFVKQIGSFPIVSKNRQDWKKLMQTEKDGMVKVAISHPKGGDPNEWPPFLQKREMPDFKQHFYKTS